MTRPSTASLRESGRLFVSPPSQPAHSPTRLAAQKAPLDKNAHQSPPHDNKLPLFANHILAVYPLNHLQLFWSGGTQHMQWYLLAVLAPPSRPKQARRDSCRCGRVSHLRITSGPQMQFNDSER
jgi:hypothetical protein